MTPELRHEPERAQKPLAEPAYARWRSPDGKVRTTFHRVDAGYLVRFLGRADFLVPSGDGPVTCTRVPRASEREARDLFLNQVLPMILGHRGELVIHASGAAIDGAAAAFVAETGRGKSTLAAAFAHAGMPFLSDDGLCLTAHDGGYLAHPNRPSFRLWQDSENEVVLGEPGPDAWNQSEKNRIAADHRFPFQAEPLPLQALYFLAANTDEPGIAPLEANEASARLMNHSFFLDAADRERMKRHFAALTGLAETVPAYVLDYPREFDRLPSVIAAVSKHFSDLGVPK